MSRVFISYRRDDTRWAAGRLYDRLKEVLGDDVFLDVTDLQTGDDFVVAIQRAVGVCDALIALIGPRWISIDDQAGRRRLDNTNDLVRVEIGTALRRKIRVLPILIDDAPMPLESELPGELKPLARILARDVSYKRFHADIDSVLKVLRRVLGGPDLRPEEVANSERRAHQAEQVGQLPFTISIETLGGEATPLIFKGVDLPAEARQTFSTADDNQTQVEIQLFVGQRSVSSENVAIGKFQLGSIPPAPKGEPQIEVVTTVDSSLVLTVTAEDLETGRKEVLDAVDLTTLDIPDEIRNEEIPQPAASPRDSQGFGTEGFSDVFKDFGKNFGGLFDGKPPENLDHHLIVQLTRQAAADGDQVEVETPTGERLRVQVPGGLKPGSKLRLQGKGKQQGDHRGDLYLSFLVDG